VVEPGPHCTDPYQCPFMGRCWPDLPAHHVSSLYRIGKRADAFVADGYPTIHDLPGDVRLSGPTARQVRSVRQGKLLVEDGLAEALAGIEAPTAFLDFETINPAIPVWKGCHPFEAIAVQMSCHVRGARGALVHHEFLAEGPGDPRRAIAQAVEAGAFVMPASPSFYSQPRTIDALVDTVVSRVLDRLGIPNELMRRWNGLSPQAGGEPTED